MRPALAAGLAALVWLGVPPVAQGSEREAIVVVMDGASLPDLVGDPALRSLAANGGIALMNGRTDVRDAFTDAFLFPRAVGRLPFPYADIGTASPSDAATVVGEEAAGLAGPTLVVVLSASPPPASRGERDELGAVIAAWGDPDELLTALGEPRALTSDSTRRAGVVATVDPAATVAAWLGLPYDAGAPIEPTDEPAPVDLYERYLQQRRLAVPVATGSWSLMGLAGVVGLLALRLRGGTSDRTLAAAGALAASLPWLALALLLVGHLPSLTPWTVLPFLLAVTAGGVAFSRWVAGRRGILAAVAATGAAILVALGIEAAIGWPAAVTPLAGGGQLDGGRFFGMPNVEIGLVLGAALYVAHRLPIAAGAALLGACALVAGSPWTGANFGAAITLFATAGLWLGIRSRRPWWIASLLTAATTAAGMAVIAVMHRFLTERPTHVTAFLERTGGVAEAIDRLVDRLGIGLDLIGGSPFALVPVIGTVVLLLVVLRPPAAVAASFAGRDAWRDAVLVLVLGSFVAYLANDTGAAALGFGFGTALSGLLDVSVATARGMMRR